MLPASAIVPAVSMLAQAPSVPQWHLPEMLSCHWLVNKCVCTTLLAMGQNLLVVAEFA